MNTNRSTPPLQGAPSGIPPAPAGPPQPYGLKKVKQKRRKWWLWIILAAIVVVGIASIAGAFLWYRNALQPVDASSTEKIRVVVEEGSTVAQIGNLLEGNDLIRSSLAFELYMRDKASPQAGGYALNQSMGVPEIANHLIEGQFDEFEVTILPGSTIWDVRDNLIESGFAEEEVDTALNATYDHPLLATKPADASLEGYIFPDTYRLEGDSTVQDLFVRTFDELYGHLQEGGLMTQFEERDLTLYEALTLASIVQKEVATTDDMRQVAQVFYKRLADDMPLGADATFIYGAKVLGVEPRVTLDSPYNTREVLGLPPGPISNMGLPALEAVANPAEGNFLYFVSGDDGTTYFTRTLEEHEEATRQYCHENCAIFEN